METLPETLDEVQAQIDALNADILLKQMEIRRYEEIGHRLVEAMFSEL